MADSYPDAPSRRMAWDADGTVALIYVDSTGDLRDSTWVLPFAPYGALSSQDAIDLNDENFATSGGNGNSRNNPDMDVALVFPEPREIDGVYYVFGPGVLFQGGSRYFHVANDSTNGYDGTWVQTTAGGYILETAPLAHYRDNIESLAYASQTACIATFARDTPGVGAITMRSFHVYGVISPAETPDRILFLDTDNADATFTKVLDFGDVPRGQTTTRTFKIKNNSSSLTINTIQVTAEDLYLNAGSWYEFGDDGVNYQGTFAVGNLSNGAEKLLYLKQVIPDAETLGVQAGRIKVSHASVS